MTSRKGSKTSGRINAGDVQPDLRPNNPLQADFNEDDSSSMDSDERYLVRSKDGY